MFVVGQTRHARSRQAFLDMYYGTLHSQRVVSTLGRPVDAGRYRNTWLHLNRTRRNVNHWSVGTRRGTLAGHTCREWHRSCMFAVHSLRCSPDNVLERNFNWTFSIAFTDRRHILVYR
jgi:hypothetical protein